MPQKRKTWIQKRRRGTWRNNVNLHGHLFVSGVYLDYYTGKFKHEIMDSVSSTSSISQKKLMLAPNQLLLGVCWAHSYVLCSGIYSWVLIILEPFFITFVSFFQAKSPLTHFPACHEFFFPLLILNSFPSAHPTFNNRTSIISSHFRNHQINQVFPRK